MIPYEYAAFGEVGGSHRLLETSLDGEGSMLEELRFIVDRPAGHVGAEVVWSPYWGCGPLGSWWVLWRGEEDRDASRGNMVRSRALLISQAVIGSTNTLQELLHYLSFDPAQSDDYPRSEVANALVRDGRPVVVPGISTAPLLLLSLWPRLWPAARRRFTLRTLFGSEGVESSSRPDVVVIPAELSPRWRAQRIVEGQGTPPDSVGASWLCGNTVPDLERLLTTNWDRLPSDLSTLQRLGRIASATKILRDGAGKLADALLIVRTVEAFPGELGLPPEDLALLVAQVSEMRGATTTDIRTASLVTLNMVGDARLSSERAVSRWIGKNLPGEADGDAMWILEHQALGHHAEWWTRSVRKGLSDSLDGLNLRWAAGLWRWWSLNPDAVEWTRELLPRDSASEVVLLAAATSDPKAGLRAKLFSVFAERSWAKLVARLIRGAETLKDAARILRKEVTDPEPGLDVLLEHRSAKEIVETAITDPWDPLVDRAGALTSTDAALLDNVRSDAPGTIVLLAAHLRAGGHLPVGSLDDQLIRRVFDGCLGGDKSCQEMVRRLESRAGAVALRYNNLNALCQSLEPAVREALLAATAAEWWKLFVADEQAVKPDGPLGAEVRNRAPMTLSRGPIQRVIRFLAAFHEVTEDEVVDWLGHHSFQWEERDAERLGELLVQRGWASAARSFRRSPRNELKSVAWHARSLLGSWYRVWGVAPFRPELDLGERNRDSQGMGRLKILFLAASPPTEASLRIDEEARAIEAKVDGSEFRDAVEFSSHWATRTGDLQKALLKEDPVVVHFSGHGSDTGIVLHSDDGIGPSRVSAAALARLFKTLKSKIRLVVLNACSSDEQAKAIVEEIDFVVGMGGSIRDDAARAFSAAFYQGLAYRKSVQTAFELGCTELQLQGLTDDEDVPVLLTRKGLDASAVTLL